jgi:hypothetical protein
MKSAVIVAIILGFVLFLASGIWSTLFPATNSWTPDKAARLSEIKGRLNDLSFQLQSAANRMHSGPDPATLKTEYDALNKEFDVLKTDFETAAERPQTVSRILKWSGLILAALGIIGWYAVKDS